MKNASERPFHPGFKNVINDIGRKIEILTCGALTMAGNPPFSLSLKPSLMSARLVMLPPWVPFKVLLYCSMLLDTSCWLSWIWDNLLRACRMQTQFSESSVCFFLYKAPCGCLWFRQLTSEHLLELNVHKHTLTKLTMAFTPHSHPPAVFTAWIQKSCNNYTVYITCI